MLRQYRVVGIVGRVAFQSRALDDAPHVQPADMAAVTAQPDPADTLRSLSPVPADLLVGAAVKDPQNTSIGLDGGGSSLRRRLLLAGRVYAT